MTINKILLFNTLSGRIEEFKPMTPGEVKIYTCGPTVYDHAHIGNFRAFVFEDLLRRFLEFSGFGVKHVMNITDVDDKTIAGANRDVGAVREPPLQRLNNYTEKYIQAFHEDIKTLNCLPPNHPAEPPRATREIPAMIALIEALVKKGAAYVSEGSVYYRVASFPGYGKLSKKKLEGNIKGARVDVDEYDKEEGADFVLWKKAKEGEPSWDSPWGKGRPGWHIECSAMSMKYLGETFDIHAGGEDLIFPHHENEIAQSEAATGKKFVNTWLHCKFLLVNGEKMSKSKGNFYTLCDLLAKGYDPMAIRYALLSVHYRQPLNFTEQTVKEAGEVIKKMDDCYIAWVNMGLPYNAFVDPHAPNTNVSIKDPLKQNIESVIEALADDLNISVALSRIFEAVRIMNTAFSEQAYVRSSWESVSSYFAALDQLLGLEITRDVIPSAEVTQLYSTRAALRSEPDFKENRQSQEKADQLRKKAESLGFSIKDGRPGEPSIVKKKRREWD